MLKEFEGLGSHKSMPNYKAPVDDVMFLLNDVFHVERYSNLPGFSDASPDIVEAILGEAAKFCEGVLTSLNRVGDKEGCKRQADGSVITPKGFKDAYKQIIEGGWVGISTPSEFGGQGLPMFMTQLVNEFSVVRQSRLCDVFRPHPGCDRRDPGARHGGAEGDVSAQDGGR